MIIRITYGTRIEILQVQSIMVQDQKGPNVKRAWFTDLEGTKVELNDRDEVEVFWEGQSGMSFTVKSDD